MALRVWAAFLDCIFRAEKTVEARALLRDGGLMGKGMTGKVSVKDDAHDIGYETPCDICFLGPPLDSKGTKRGDVQIVVHMD